MSSVKQKLFEKNCRIQFLEKQSLRDKAELDAKDKLFSKILPAPMGRKENNYDAGPSLIKVFSWRKGVFSCVTTNI